MLQGSEKHHLCAISFTRGFEQTCSVHHWGDVLSGAVSSACAHWCGLILLIVAVPIRSPELILHLSSSAHLGCHSVDREECREGGDCIMCVMNCCVRSLCLSQTQECLGDKVSIICQSLQSSVAG